MKNKELEEICLREMRDLGWHVSIYHSKKVCVLRDGMYKSKYFKSFKDAFNWAMWNTPNEYTI